MGTITKVFGELTFNNNIMKNKLSKNIYAKLMATIQEGLPLDESIAADVAHAMKEWAIENGATHFTHWFQPQRGGTAEKHDAFIAYGEAGEIVERFSAKQLIQSEPDASSFPSGGMRSTFEARGYTAWDPTSPAFLLEVGNTKTLVIPCVFLSWTGNVLDLKTPMLRSMRALNDSAIRLQRILGNNAAKRIKVFAGPEQEYFLFSKELYAKRPDLRVCGRTLFGARPAKGQQMEDHYFAAIKDKVIMFMEELDIELYRRGIPSKTRHNEVSPNQFEIAPLYEEANLAIDHNLQLMDILAKVADRHGMVAVLHEKPLAGVNGSGKHFNWSLGDNSDPNYLEPSKSPLQNINFLMTIAAVLIGVNRYGGLLRAAVAEAGNDHRLGANEAPPAIMSVYLGEYLDSLFNEIAGIGKITEQTMSHINLGLQNLPKVAKDTSDRNRTSPLAFTGNKFEFRAVGSAQNCAEAATILNLLAAYGYDEISERLNIKDGNIKNKAILVMKDVLKETKRVRFEGNCYSLDWHKEAKRRGLPNKKTTPEALALMTDKKVIELFTRYKILTELELRSKNEIKLDNYIKVKEIELRVAIDIVKTKILPAVLKQIRLLTSAVANGNKPLVLTNEIKKITSLYKEINACLIDLEAALIYCNKQAELNEEALAYAKRGATALEQLRIAVDKAEVAIADEFWPMAKYQDLLITL